MTHVLEIGGDRDKYVTSRDPPGEEDEGHGLAGEAMEGRGRGASYLEQGSQLSQQLSPAILQTGRLEAKESMYLVQAPVVINWLKQKPDPDLPHFPTSHNILLLLCPFPGWSTRCSIHSSPRSYSLIPSVEK